MNLLTKRKLETLDFEMIISSYFALVSTKSKTLVKDKILPVTIGDVISCEVGVKIVGS